MITGLMKLIHYKICLVEVIHLPFYSSFGNTCNVYTPSANGANAKIALNFLLIYSMINPIILANPDSANCLIWQWQFDIKKPSTLIYIYHLDIANWKCLIYLFLLLFEISINKLTKRYFSNLTKLQTFYSWCPYRFLV